MPRARWRDRRVPVERHLEHLYEGGDRADERHQAQGAAQVDVGQSRPRERSVLQQVPVDEMVRGTVTACTTITATPTPTAVLDLARDREQRAHAEEKREREILDEDRVEEDLERAAHDVGSSP